MSGERGGKELSSFCYSFVRHFQFRPQLFKARSSAQVNHLSAATYWSGSWKKKKFESLHFFTTVGDWFHTRPLQLQHF